MENLARKWRMLHLPLPAAIAFARVRVVRIVLVRVPLLRMLGRCATRWLRKPGRGKLAVARRAMKDPMAPPPVYARHGTVMKAVEDEEIERRGGYRFPELKKIRAGDWVEVTYALHLKRSPDQEEEKPSKLTGLVLWVRNKGLHSSFSVRGPIHGYGTEIQFPFFGPWIQNIRIIQHFKVKRHRLYYIAEKYGVYHPEGKLIERMRMEPKRTIT